MLEVPDMTPHLPLVKNTWTIGTVLASVTSIMSLVTVIGSIIWYSAHIDVVVQTVPDLRKQQEESKQAIGDNREAIAVLQNQMNYTNVRYAEIQLALARINDKLDKSISK